MRWIKFFVFSVALLLIAATNPPLTIESDSLVIEGAQNRAVFEGNVNVVHDDSKINADKMIVFYDADKKPDKVNCEGHIKFAREDMYGLSDFAEMDLKENIIKLLGNVKVWQGDNYLEGEEVVIYNKTERIDIKQKEGKRVKIIFTPEEKGNSIGNSRKKPEESVQEKDSRQ